MTIRSKATKSNGTYCKPLTGVPEGTKRKETVKRSSFPGDTGRSIRAKNDGMLSIEVLLTTVRLAT
jgi:hypothetical protein